MDVRVHHEALSIDRAAKQVAVCGQGGVVRTESYDKLLLATGSSPLMPPLPGIACGMAAAGMKTGIFFTFWGLSVLRKDPPTAKGKAFLARMFGWMLPRGAKRLALSKMHMAGLGTAMMKSAMKTQNVATLPDLMDQARALGVKFTACEMAMGVMGLSRDELVDVDEVAGVASFVANARNGGAVLFV